MQRAIAMAASTGRPYTCSPLPVFGVEVKGVDLKQRVAPDVVEQIKEDVTR